MNGRVLVCLAVLCLVAACADQGDQPPAEPPATSRPVSPTSSAPLVLGLADVGDVLLTRDDLGDVEPQEYPQLPFLATCLRTAPAAGAYTKWIYSDGSDLVQAVETYERPTEQIETFRASDQCMVGQVGGWRPGPVLGALPVDGQHSWCFSAPDRKGCAAAVAKGNVLVFVMLVADRVDEAGRRLAQIVPLAVTALDRR